MKIKDPWSGVELQMPFYKHVDTCGCAESAPEDAEVPVRTLTLNYTEETGGEAMTFGLTLEDDKTEYLPTVMAAFEKVLHAMGFDYVSLVNIGEGHGTYGYGRVN